MNKLTTLAQIREALATPGAMLHANERMGATTWSVQRPGFASIPCALIADRLTWAATKNGVKFSHRTALDRFYAPVAK